MNQKERVYSHNVRIWNDRLIDELSDEFYDRNEDWVREKVGQFYIWAIQIYYDRDLTKEQAARLIERGHRMFIKNRKN